MFIEKMSLIEGIGDEVTNFFVLLITITVIYIAWRSTNVRENRTQRAGAVFIIDYNRRIRDHRVTQNPFTMSILRSSSRQSNSSNATEELEIEEQITSQVDELSATVSEPPNLLTVLDEINNLNTGQNHHHIDTVDSGPEQIIQEMDRDTNDGLRRRHVNPRDGGENQATVDEPIVSEQNYNETETANSENCANENNENSNLNRISNESALQNQRNLLEEPKFEMVAPIPAEDEIRIKLKYLNDELKLVSGLPSEPVGDFKKRNFTVELADQKSVRLVFNGHVLQPDTKTLQSCGLFDNCVVHCLIHNKKPNQMHGDGNNRSTNNLNEGSDNTNFNLPQMPHATNRERAENGPLLIYLGMCFITLVLICGWYCRFRYNFLFSWYSTTGLVLMTLLFLVMIPLNVLLERETTG